MANHTNGNNNNTCFQFGVRDVEIITKVKIGLAAGGVFTSIVAIIIIVAGKQFRQKFIYRMVGYLMFTAMLESVVYILEEVPLHNHNNHVALRNESIFEVLCVGAGVLSQFAVWLEDIVVIWIVVYLFLLAVCNYAHRNEQKGNACSTREVCGVIISLATAALFCWIPFVKDMYGFAGLWCWIKLTKEDCHSDYTLGLAYQFTLYYGPLLIVVVISVFSFLTIVIVLCKRTIQGERGCCQPSIYRTALFEAFPLLLYAVVYDLMVILAITNRIYYAIQIPHGIKPNYQLWLTIAIDDPLRALLPPVAFVLHCVIKFMCRKVVNARERTTTYVVIPNEDEDMGGDKERIVIRSECRNVVHQDGLFEGPVQ